MPDTKECKMGSQAAVAGLDGQDTADCIKLVQEKGRGILGKITTMDKRAVSVSDYVKSMP